MPVPYLERVAVVAAGISDATAMARLLSRGDVQVVIATHSPILLTFPDAAIVSFDDPCLPHVRLEDTAHFQITKGILDAPGRYWKHLLHDPARMRNEGQD
jgi:predicted ATPase